MFRRVNEPSKKPVTPHTTAEKLKIPEYSVDKTTKKPSKATALTPPNSKV